MKNFETIKCIASKREGAYIYLVPRGYDTDVRIEAPYNAFNIWIKCVEGKRISTEDKSVSAKDFVKALELSGESFDIETTEAGICFSSEDARGLVKYQEVSGWPRKLAELSFERGIYLAKRDDVEAALKLPADEIMLISKENSIKFVGIDDLGSAVTFLDVPVAVKRESISREGKTLKVSQIEILKTVLQSVGETVRLAIGEDYMGLYDENIFCVTPLVESRLQVNGFDKLCEEAYREEEICCFDKDKLMGWLEKSEEKVVFIENDKVIIPFSDNENKGYSFVKTIKGENGALGISSLSCLNKAKIYKCLKAIDCNCKKIKIRAFGIYEGGCLGYVIIPEAGNVRFLVSGVAKEGIAGFKEKYKFAFPET